MLAPELFSDAEKDYGYKR